MSHEKFSNAQKKSMAKLDPHGREIDLLSIITDVSKTTIYKAKREGALLNRIEMIEKRNRELIVENQVLQSMLSQKGSGQRKRHS